MSIESTLERIATSCERQERLLEQLLKVTEDYPDLFAQQQAPEPAPATAAAFVPPPAAAFVPPPAAPEPTPAPAPAPAAAAFVPPPAPPATVATVPFTDQAGLIKYGMEKYRTLGAAKGGLIQNVIVDMGFNNLSKIPSERWADFVSRCEAL
jgi:hypothetical protein